jgi:DNA-binding response OmpR family regulator
MITRLCDDSSPAVCDFCNKSAGPDDDHPAHGVVPAGPAWHTEGAVNTLLFIEDDDGIRLALRLALEDEGYEVHEAVNGADGLASFREHAVDLVLLDLRLPDISGFDVCRLIRAESIVPIIIITAQTDTHDMVAGLEAGADDYVTKPVVPKELAARIRALLRRVHLQEVPAAPKAQVFGDVELRREQGIVLKRGQEVGLTKTEYRLLSEFADHAGAVLSRDQLLERVWGYEYLGDSRLVDAHVRRLRLKIEDHPDDPKLIVTIRGIGYRLMNS